MSLSLLVGRTVGLRIWYFLPLECLPVIEAALLSTICKREPVVKILSSGPSTSSILLFLLLQPWFKNTIRNTSFLYIIEQLFKSVNSQF